jgi:uncharacterized membrane protein YphA (DoxX/SURF4 family)
MSPASAQSGKMRMLILLARVGLGVIFLYAAYTKLRVPWAIFAMSINSYELLPEPLVIFIARVLPWLELALGVLLIAGWKLRYAAAATSALLVTFFVIMLRSYFKGLGIDCGCFGVGEALTAKTLARDGALTLLSIGLTVAAFVAHRDSKLEIRNSTA